MAMEHMDGVLLASVMETPNISGGTWVTLGSAGDINYYYGAVHDVRVYKCALNATEVAGLN